MTYWVNVGGITVAYKPECPEETTYYDREKWTWFTANPALIAQAAEALRMQGVQTAAGKPAGEGEKPPKPKRKELMRQIANLTETVAGLQKRIDASPENQLKALQQRLGELEHHLNTVVYEASLYRRIIREAGNGHRDAPTARQLFKMYFNKDIEDYDVELSAEETAKVFEKRQG